MTEAFRLLIVDDDLADRKMLRRALLQALPDSEVCEAESIRAAFETHADAVFDLVLLDFRMPGINGLEALGRVMDDWPGAAVVMITGQGDETTATEALKLGAIDYLPKVRISATTIGPVVTSAVATMRQRLALAEARKELQTFADRLVHDLQSPLRAIDFFVDQAVTHLDEGDLAQARERLGRTRNTAQRMSLLIDGLAAYLRVDRRTARGCVDMGCVAESALANLAAELDACSAEIVVGGLPQVSGDEVLLVQLLQNLVANALKFRSQSPPRVEIAGSSDATIATVTVADNGPGIPAHLVPNIFEPFIRCGTQPGSGLGLATCQRIVARHRGDITCNSTVGEGTMFVITLPIEPEKLARYSRG